MLVARSLKPAVPYLAGLFSFKNYYLNLWSSWTVDSCIRQYLIFIKIWSIFKDIKIFLDLSKIHNQLFFTTNHSDEKSPNPKKSDKKNKQTYNNNIQSDKREKSKNKQCQSISDDT